jgi:hypothetical protein
MDVQFTVPNLLIAQRHNYRLDGFVRVVVQGLLHPRDVARVFR